MKRGYAINYLLPQGLAVEANDANRKWFESQRKKIDAVTRRLEINETVSLESAENSLRLWRLSKLVSREYEQVKARRRGLDFDDLLVLTRQALVRHPERIKSAVLAVCTKAPSR